MPPILRPAAHSSISLRALKTSIASLLPRSALLSPEESASLQPRQNGGNGIIPSYYQDLNSGPAPGIVVGAVLGAVAGFLLLAWLVWTIANFSGGAIIGGEEEIVVRKQPRSRPSRRSRSTREIREVREVSVGRSPRRERIIVTDEVRRSSRPVSRPRSRSIIVEERVEHRVPGDDMVEVIEEVSDITASTPPRRKSSRRDPGGYRSVNPNLYAGGDYPQRPVRSRRSSSRS